MSLKLQATIGQRGQVVIPKPIRDAFNLQPGTSVNFSVEDDRVVVTTPEGVLDAFVDAVEKQPEPESIDWDERYYTQVDG